MDDTLHKRGWSACAVPRVAAPVAWRLVIAVLAVLAWGATSRTQDFIVSDDDRPAPFNYGFGIGARVPDAQRDLWDRAIDAVAGRGMTPFEAQRAIAALPHGLVAPPTNGGPNAGVSGVFGPVLPWPIIPLHMALLPDGKVLTYGTDQSGRQGAALFYDVWDPTQPYQTSQMVLPNTTATDIFCSGMGLLPNGNLLITGGDVTINGIRNFSNASVTVFNTPSEGLTANGVMHFPRWYPADVPLVNGDHLILGGRSNRNPQTPVTIPEYYSVATNSFTALTGANTTVHAHWYYPKTFVTSSGSILLIDQQGELADFTTAGLGGFTILPNKADVGLYDVPTVMYAPGEILSIRKPLAQSGTSESYRFDNIDVSGAAPVVTRVAEVPGAGREWANMTVLANGQVFVNGGSGVENELQLVSYVSYLYAPSANGWTQAGTAVEPRLYHSAALLLPDGTVLTGGGGAPGPINELNAEVYYPPYLFTQDGTGDFATRPVVVGAPSAIAAGVPFALTMGDATPVSRVSLIRLGAVTHSTSLQTRFISAGFTQSGSKLTVTPPTNTNDLLTGYWMVFVFNAAGVPSIAPIVDVPPPL